MSAGAGSARELHAAVVVLRGGFEVRHAPLTVLLGAGLHRFRTVRVRCTRWVPYRAWRASAPVHR